jgi:hypothetical protein
MPIRMIAVALALLAGAAPALAQGCGHDRQAQISCAEGQSWDATAQKCVTVGS